MNNPEKHEMKSNDEIDLRDLFIKLKKLFSRFFSFFFYLFKLIYKRWAFFTIIIIIGSSLTYGFYSSKPPYYNYSMTALLSEVRNDLIENQVSNLALMVADNNGRDLSKKLGVSEEQAKSIKSIAFRNIDQDKIPEDSILASSPFEVNVQLYDNTNQDAIQVGIIKYLENNAYLAKQKQIKKEHLSSIVAKLNINLRTIDSLVQTSGSPKGPVNGFVYGGPLDPANLYRESINMLERKTGLEAALKRLEYIDVIVNFVPRIHPSGPSLKKYLVAGALISFLIALSIALIQDRKQRV